MRGRAKLWLIGGLLMALGCAHKAYVRPGWLEHPPRRLAVLPFSITYAYDLAPGEPIPESHTLGRDVFRKTFYQAVSPYGFQDLKPADIDATLAAKYGPDPAAWAAATPLELGTALGADALIYGEISRINHLASPMYTEASLSANLRMVDARTGEVLWRKSASVAERGGAALQKGQVVDFIQDQAISYNPGTKFLRIADMACRNLLQEFPNPELPPGEAVETRASAGTLRIAVLPFDASRSGWLDHAEEMRLYLAADLQEGPFTVVENQAVDAALAKLTGWTRGQPPPADLQVQELAHAVGADVVLRGTLTKWGRTYLVAQSWVKAEMSVELTDAASGETIWGMKKANSRTAGILKGPTGYKSLVTPAITNLKSSNLDRVGNNLTHMLAEEIRQSPAIMAYVAEQEAIVRATRQ